MQYWLMKSEPDVYSIQDLKRDKTAMWEGCRNYQVRNMLRDSMQINDLAFFYHSNAKPSGIVGIMKIVSHAYPDPTQFEKESEYYDEKSSRENPRWYVRDVEFVEEFSDTITLQDMREIPELNEMLVLRKGQRLSITPVSPEEWKSVIGLDHKK